MMADFISHRWQIHTKTRGDGLALPALGGYQRLNVVSFLAARSITINRERRLIMTYKLPPDPEGMNERRTAWAGLAIAAFRDATGADPEDALPDLLADLMHWCDRKGSDFDAALERGRYHYEAETTEEGRSSAMRGIIP
jgi:hypothetical protein